MPTESNAAREDREKLERPPRIGKWQPKRWKPEYEKIVALSAAGHGNKDIVVIMATYHNIEYTKEHISQILNTPQAEEFREMVVKKMRENTLEDLPKMLANVQMKALKRVDEILSNDDHVDKSPFALMDRALDVLKGVGVMKGAGGSGGVNLTINNQQNNSNVNLAPEIAERLATGLDKANEVARIHANVSGEDRR